MKMTKWMTWFRVLPLASGGCAPATPRDSDAFNLVCAVNGVKVDLGEKITK